MDKYYAKPNITIEEHAEMLIQELNKLKDYGYIEDERLYHLIFLACRHHDDGKVNEEFQKRVKGFTKKFNPEKELPHNVLSGYLLDREEFETDEDYYKVLFSIVFHHNYGDPIEMMKNRKELAKELLKDFTIYKMPRSKINKIQEMILDMEAIKIKGFLHKCDYSASGGYVSEYPNTFLEDAMENVRMKWREIDRNSDWNELQKFCMNKRNENIIAIAQTGMGKTEAGLQWIGNHKGYFVLPLRTAINAIYDRVKRDILKAENIDSVDTRLSILHSESLEYYMGQYEQDNDLEEYEKRGKRFTVPLNISTMDQLFDFVFKYPGYELKLTTLSYSKIVIDEIQMYDPELLRYLIYGLKLVTQMGGKVAVMTATLSPFVKELLMQAIPFKEENIQVFVDDMLRHHIEARECKINADDIAEFYGENKKNGKANKILVVCNTIHKAQQIYEELKEITGDKELHILHSRFTRKDRAQKEKEIIAFGRTYDKNGQLDCQSGIWISTSLVEASLDIDFDYLFTELQDLNSLFQRLGRCNRKGKKDNTKPNCFIYTVIDGKTLTTGSTGFIDQVMYELSKKAVKEGCGLLSEKRKIELINKYMTMENLKGSDYYRRYKQAEWIETISAYKFEKDDNRLRNILSQDIIPSPVFELKKEEILGVVNCLAEKSLPMIERIKLKEALMQYSVSIPYWQWVAYLKAQRTGLTQSFPIIEYGRFQSIPVMECHYDEAGYRPLDYKNEKREPVFL